MKKEKIFNRFSTFLIVVVSTLLLVTSVEVAQATTSSITTFIAKPYIHPLTTLLSSPQGLSPNDIKKIYNLPTSGGSGTIAIITAYSYPKAESDLHVFDQTFNLPACTVSNTCLEIHPMTSSMVQDSSWNMETALDIEWAHAIAPTAKILLIEAKTSNGKDLESAIKYASSRSDVVAVSMSWGGPEFKDETNIDTYFKKSPSKMFFAASGDTGTGASWPAASQYVVAVGGTSLSLTGSSKIISEKAWSGSGGGISDYESEPGWQKSYSIGKANNKRAIPDVSYNADPHSGYSIYRGGWYVVGGTSAGSPQWAAIQALGHSVILAKLYQDKASSQSYSYFRDIMSGSNGTCTYYCNARARYDYVTGLGSPLTVTF